MDCEKWLLQYVPEWGLKNEEFMTSVGKQAFTEMEKVNTCWSKNIFLYRITCTDE